jgi:uncharacterized membrane protein
MEWLEYFDKSLSVIAAIVKFCLETLSVFCVVAGLFKTAQLAANLQRRYPRGQFPFTKIRLSFGTWLSLALEFQLGADIVATTTSPSDSNLIKLGVIAVIRTFLNYFLARELEAEQRLESESKLASLEEVSEHAL